MLPVKASPKMKVKTVRIRAMTKEEGMNFCEKLVSDAENPENRFITKVVKRELSADTEIFQADF